MITVAVDMDVLALMEEVVAMRIVDTIVIVVTDAAGIMITAGDVDMTMAGTMMTAGDAEDGKI